MKYVLSIVYIMIMAFFSACGGGGSSASAPISTGILDTSFDSVGYSVHDSAAGGSNIDEAKSLAIDANGKLVLTGYSSNGLNYDMTIWRYNSDGSLDTSFNGIGYVTHDNAAGGSGVDVGVSLLIDANGKIVVTGYSTSTSNGDMTIWRYNSDGSLDTSFNGVGYINHDNAAGGAGNDRGNDVSIDVNGKIVVTGYSSNGTDFDMVLWRYNSNGSLDTSFNGLGYAAHNNAAGGSGSDIGRSLAIDSSDKIVVSGYSYNGTNNDMALWRYNSNGTLDTGFNSVGYASHDSAAGGAGQDEAESLVIDANAKIVVTGFSFNGTNNDMALWRYNNNGTLDTSFNSLGYVSHNNAAGGTANDEGKSLVIDANAKIVVTGFSFNGTNNDMALWRYNSDGSLDTSFNSLGYSVHDSAAGGLDNDSASAVVIDQDSKIVVAGRSFNGSNYDMSIWRYE